MIEKFPELMAATKPQIQEAQRILSRINTRPSSPRYIILHGRKNRDKEKSWNKLEGWRLVLLSIEEQERDNRTSLYKLCKQEKVG